MLGILVTLHVVHGRQEFAVVGEIPVNGLLTRYLAVEPYHVELPRAAKHVGLAGGAVLLSPLGCYGHRRTAVCLNLERHGAGGSTIDEDGAEAGEVVLVACHGVGAEVGFGAGGDEVVAAGGELHRGVVALDIGD